jgi:ankyrin repeat protein
MKYLLRELTEAACYSCDPNRRQEILDAGFDINTQDESDMTILMYTVVPDRLGDINAPESILKLVEFLLE